MYYYVVYFIKNRLMENYNEHHKIFSVKSYKDVAFLYPIFIQFFCPFKITMGSIKINYMGTDLKIHNVSEWIVPQNGGELEYEIMSNDVNNNNPCYFLQFSIQINGNTKCFQLSNSITSNYLIEKINENETKIIIPTIDISKYDVYYI
jgi:hypothetical protein